MKQMSFIAANADPDIEIVQPIDQKRICGAHDYCAIDLYDLHGKWSDSLVKRAGHFEIGSHLHSIASYLSDTPHPYFLIRHGRATAAVEPDLIDIQTTRTLAMMARMLGVRLHDLIIETDAARFSFRNAGLL